MPRNNSARWFASVVGVSAVVAVACSSGADNASSGGTSGSSSGSTASFKSCPTSLNDECSDADLKPYSDCVSNACDTQFKQCYGADYKNGSFGGVCGPYVTCVQKCACSDTACTTACGQAQGIMECGKCLGTLTCADACTLPACASSSSSSSSSSGATGGGKTCADLLSCCNGTSDAEDKQGCIALHGQAAGNDTTCDVYYSALKSAGKCN